MACSVCTAHTKFSALYTMITVKFWKAKGFNISPPSLLSMQEKQCTFRFYCVTIFGFKSYCLGSWLHFLKSHELDFGSRLQQNFGSFWNGSNHTSAILYYIFRCCSGLTMDNYNIKIPINSENCRWCWMGPATSGIQSRFLYVKISTSVCSTQICFQKMVKLYIYNYMYTYEYIGI